MPWYILALTVLCLCCTVALIFLKAFKVGNRRRGVVKMLTAVCFLAIGVVGCIQRQGGLSVLLAVGLLFAALGDFCLVFMDDKRWFLAGVLSFSGASLTLSVYSLAEYSSVWQRGWIWLALGVFALVAIGNVLGQKTKLYSFGKFFLPLNVYTVLVGLCASLGLTLCCLSATNTKMLLYGLGCLMYFLSDVCLGLYMFKLHNRVVDAVNTALYFPGMLLIALSLVV